MRSCDYERKKVGARDVGYKWAVLSCAAILRQAYKDRDLYISPSSALRISSSILQAQHRLGSAYKNLHAR